MKKIFVNGSFDIIHTGHLELLNYARSLGDFLLVAIDSDERIREKKGYDRPFNNQENRTTLMKNIRPVNDVKVFSSDEELIKIIADYEPDIMIVGSDWKGKNIIGSQHAKELVFYDRTNDESTTKTIENYINRR